MRYTSLPNPSNERCSNKSHFSGQWHGEHLKSNKQYYYILTPRTNRSHPGPMSPSTTRKYTPCNIFRNMYRLVRVGSNNQFHDTPNTVLRTTHTRTHRRNSQKHQRLRRDSKTHIAYYVWEHAECGSTSTILRCTRYNSQLRDAPVCIHMSALCYPRSWALTTPCQVPLRACGSLSCSICCG